MTLFGNSSTESFPLFSVNALHRLIQHPDARYWVLWCALAVLSFALYINVSLDAGQGELLMPLDDSYIHFQYARQMINGEPYVYNPGDVATSGATSFLYPYVLSVGYAVGFRGLWLGLWAMIIGVTAFVGSMATIHYIVRHIDERIPRWFSAGFAVMFGVSGLMVWHYMSGMETGLVITLTFVTLYSFVRRSLRWFIVSATLLALMRPEGSIMAIIAVLLYGIRAYQQGHLMRRLMWLGLPTFAIVIQPTLNLLLTGSVSSTGNQAKSILSMIPGDRDVIIERILDNFVRTWAEFATGTGGEFLPLMIFPFALVGFIIMLLNRETRYTALLIAGWMIAVSGAIATLDTAFWHFKRYQVPLIALFFPLAAIGVWWFSLRISGSFSTRFLRRIRVGLTALFILVMLPTFSHFLRLYEVNVDNIAAQPYPMALWLAENTPEDAVIAVHDVGMMRYVGERYTIDMVGLTTASAADYWRNGPGAVAEFLHTHDPQPDYVAAYTTARGLNYLEATDIYGELLAEFSAQYDPADNVALGAEFQGIYRFEPVQRVDFPVQTAVWEQLSSRAVDGLPVLVDYVDVANLFSERDHDYHWQTTGNQAGFPTEVYQFSYDSCELPQTMQTESPCDVLDGGRRINTEERFTMSLRSSAGGAVLLTRLHPAFSGSFDVYVNDTYVARRTIPMIPGRWLDVATFIPPEIIDGSTGVHFRIAPDVNNGFYMPYMHQLLQLGSDELYRAWLEDSPRVTYQDGAISLMALSFEQTADALALELIWQTDGTAYGDYRFFVHVYDDVNNTPVAQWDGYTNETLTPANWLAGTLTDTVMVDLTGLSSGQYEIAIGFYDPQTFERLLPTAVTYDPERIDAIGERVFIGKITLP